MNFRNLIIALLFILLPYLSFSDYAVIPPNYSNVYFKHESGFAVKSLDDIDKQFNSKDSALITDRITLTIGNKVAVVKNKKINDKYYLNIQTPDKQKYWAPLDYFAIKFISIIHDDLPCYKQPDDSYPEKFKLFAGASDRCKRCLFCSFCRRFKIQGIAVHGWKNNKNFSQR